jgi:chromosome condensin MukBEF MukE localization factor
MEKSFTFDEINETGKLLCVSGSLPCRSRTENEGIFLIDEAKEEIIALSDERKLFK